MMNTIATHFWRVLVLVSVGLFMAPQGAYACSVCFGLGVDNATTRGISMAMLGLLVVLGVVWGGIGAFFINMRRRANMLEPGEWIVTEQGHIESQDDVNERHQ